MKLNDFPDFMKIDTNHIDPSFQNTKDIDGYYYTANDGSQMAFWTCHSDRESKKHCHPFDEYTIVITGQYTVCLEDGQEIILNPGDEYYTPANTVQWGRCIAGTRSIHAFGGKRIR